MKRKTTFNSLIERNEFPIVFIGSGVSKRYLKEYPSWDELLEKLWHESGQDKSFYSYLNTVKNEILKQGEINESLLKHKIYTRVAPCVRIVVIDLQKKYS